MSFARVRRGRIGLDDLVESVEFHNTRVDERGGYRTSLRERGGRPARGELAATRKRRSTARGWDTRPPRPGQDPPRSPCSLRTRYPPVAAWPGSRCQRASQPASRRSVASPRGGLAWRTDLGRTSGQPACRPAGPHRWPPPTAPAAACRRLPRAPLLSILGLFSLKAPATARG